MSDLDAQLDAAIEGRHRKQAAPLASVTQGSSHRVREVDGFRFTEAQYPGGYSLPRHIHRHPSLTIGLSGSFIEVFDSNAPIVSRGDVLIKPSDAVHENRYGESGARCLIVEILPSRLESVRAVTDVFEVVGHVPARDIAGWARQVASEHKSDDDAAPLALEALLFDFLARQVRRTAVDTKTRSALTEALALIDAGYHKPLLIKDIAEQVGVTPGHLARAFRQHFGTAPGTYLRRLRVSHVKKLLRETNIPISRIALEAGFADQSHLTRVFRQHEGWTPGRFRRHFQPH